MKQLRILGMIGMVVLTLGLFNSAGAQQKGYSSDTTRHHFRGGFARRPMGIQGLTSDQQKKIEALNLTFRKETLQLKNQLEEKRAHLHTLQSADKADLTAINSSIDEIGQLHTQMMKKEAAKHEAIRRLLTDEQRVAFDTHKPGRGRMRGRDHHNFREDHSRN